MEEKSVGKLLFYGVLFIVLFVALIRIFVNTTGNFFNLELIGLIFLLVLALIGFIGYKTWGEEVFFAIFLLYIVNLALIWYFRDSLFFVLFLLAIGGLVLSASKKLSQHEEEEPDSEVFDEPEEKKSTSTKKTAVK